MGYTVLRIAESEYKANQQAVLETVVAAVNCTFNEQFKEQR